MSTTATTEKKWYEVLDALYATRLDVQEIKIWQDYLRRESINSAELIPAIEQAAEAGRKPQDWKVTVRDLINWVRIHRARTFRAAPRMELEQHHLNLIAEWKCKLQNGEATEDDFIERVVTLPVRNTKIIKEIAWQVLGYHRL